jgi:hypothetical protein
VSADTSRLLLERLPVRGAGRPAERHGRLRPRRDLHRHGYRVPCRRRYGGRSSASSCDPAEPVTGDRRLRTTPRARPSVTRARTCATSPRRATDGGQLPGGRPCRRPPCVVPRPACSLDSAARGATPAASRHRVARYRRRHGATWPTLPGDPNTSQDNDDTICWRRATHARRAPPGRSSRCRGCWPRPETTGYARQAVSRR